MSEAARSAVVFDGEPEPIFLMAVKELLERIDLAVRGFATSRMEAVKLVEAHLPSVLLVGVDCQDGGEGRRLTSLIERAREVDPELKVVVLTPEKQPQLVEAAFAAGADACCTKTAATEDLGLAIRQLFERSVYLTPPDLQATGAMRTTHAVDDRDLTRREREILCLVAEGRSNTEAARTLWVTESTVKFHLSRIYKKLGVSNRTEAARWAQLHGLLSREVERTGTRKAI